MKKLFILILGCFLISSSVNSGPTKYWPVYINNSDCFTKGQCGELELNIYPSGNGVFYEENLYEKGVQAGVVTKQGQGYKVKFDGIQFGGYSFQDNNKLVLFTTNGNPSGYALSGLENMRVTFQVVLCDLDRSAFCHSDRSPVNYDYDLLDLLGKNLSFEAGKGQAVKSIKAWFTGPGFYLTTVKGRNLQVRSLALPNLHAKSMYFYRDSTSSIVGKPWNSHKMIYPQETRLNHRVCTISADNTKVSFGTITLQNAETGKVSQEFGTMLKLKCYGEGEWLVEDGWTKLKWADVKGDGVVHSVEKIAITTDNQKNIAGAGRIGFKHETTGNVSDIFYVEGSFVQNSSCGQNSLIVGDNYNASYPKTFPGTSVSGNDTIDIDYSTIYWKICKITGEVPPGKYSANAKVKIHFK